MPSKWKSQYGSAASTGDGASPVPDPKYLKEARKTLFQKVDLIRNGVVVRKPRIDHYMSALAQEAAREASSAHREIRKLRKIRGLPPRVRRTTRVPSLIAHALDRQERLAEFIYRAFWPAAFGMWSGIAAHFTGIHGDLGDTTEVLPKYMWSHPSFAEFLKALKKHKRKQAKGKPYDVGHSKPPTSTRFVKGQSGNAKGCPKRKNPFDTLEESLSEMVSVKKADGSTIEIARMEAALIRVWTEAMRGVSSARCELCEIIKTLHEEDLFTPLPKPRKARIASGEDGILLSGCRIVMIGFVKRDLVNRFTAKYGPAPPFTTRFERLFPALHKISGFAEAVEKRRKDGKSYLVLEEALSQSRMSEAQTGGDQPHDPVPGGTASPDAAAVIDAELDVEWQAAKGASDAADGRDDDRRPAPAALIPTRKRTRSVPAARNKPAPAASSDHPALPRAKVPIVKAPAVKKPAFATSEGKPRS